MKTRLSALVCAAALTGLAPGAHAASVIYDYFGTVEVCDDSDIGGGICGVLISVGDTIGGAVEFDAANGFTNVTFTTDDVITYIVGLADGGGLGADPSNSELDPASFVTTDADGLAVEGFFSVLIDPTELPLAINADITNQTWEMLLFPGVLDLSLVRGSGGFGAPTPVPLPAGLTLLASALTFLRGRTTAKA